MVYKKTFDIPTEFGLQTESLVVGLETKSCLQLYIDPSTGMPQLFKGYAEAYVCADTLNKTRKPSRLPHDHHESNSNEWEVYSMTFREAEPDID